MKHYSCWCWYGVLVQSTILVQSTGSEHRFRVLPTDWYRVLVQSTGKYRVLDGTQYWPVHRNGWYTVLAGTQYWQRVLLLVLNQFISCAPVPRPPVTPTSYPVR